MLPYTSKPVPSALSNTNRRFAIKLAGVPTVPWSKTRGAVAEEVVIEVVVFFVAGFVVVMAFFAFATVAFEEVVLPRALVAVYSAHDMLVTFFEEAVAFVDEVLA